MILGTLDEIFDAQVFQTRADAEAAGIHHPYDPAKPVKNWIGKSGMVPVGETILYNTVAMTKAGTVLLRGDLPYFTLMPCPEADWGKLNQPDKALVKDNAPAQMDYSHNEMPVPMRQLAADEEFYLRFGGIPDTRKKGSAAGPAPAGGSVDLAGVYARFDEIDAKLALILAAKV